MLQKLVQHRYAITLGVFLVWMLFFDQNNMMEQFKLRSQLNDLKSEKQYYIQEMEKAQREYDELFTNQQSLEKFAREKYLMKKDNEDIFVIVPEE
ncbi:MAG: septum formation initiator family protein [Bacteroidota bacterium]|nr:septum formation initiator family protein [Bacteroidota bacterium]MDX5430663.1 septum formation initiator family protein [Bacteroidota bacterium]MDX5469410.1 septum formation initiator family protein [Bacteroidota bacterium]